MNNRKLLYQFNTLKESKIKKDNKKNQDRKGKTILRYYIDKKEIDKLITHKKVDLRNQTYKRNEHLINESKFSGKDLFSNNSPLNISNSQLKINIKSNSQRDDFEGKINNCFNNKIQENVNLFKSNNSERLKKNHIINGIIKKRNMSSKNRQKNFPYKNLNLKYSHYSKSFNLINNNNSTSNSKLEFSTYDKNDKLIKIFEQIEQSHNIIKNIIPLKLNLNQSCEFKQLISGNTFSKRIKEYIEKQKENKKINKSMKIHNKEIELNKSINEENKNKNLQIHKLFNYKKYFSKKNNIKKQNSQYFYNNKNLLEVNQKLNNKEKKFYSKIPIFLKINFLHEKKEYKSPRARPYSSLTKRYSSSEKKISNLKNDKKSKNSFLINQYCLNELGEPSKYENFLFSANDEIIE